MNLAVETDDRKMFAPLFRGQARSPETEVCTVLSAHTVGATAAGLADELLRLGLAIGLRAPVTKRIAELLDDLERASRVERIPDGRYRVVKVRR